MSKLKRLLLSDLFTRHVSILECTSLHIYYCLGLKIFHLSHIAKTHLLVNSAFLKNSYTYVGKGGRATQIKNTTKIRRNLWTPPFNVA